MPSAIAKLSTIQQSRKDILMKQVIYTMRDYPEAVIFMCLVGIFMTGVYLGIITERQKWGN